MTAHVPFDKNTEPLSCASTALPHDMPLAEAVLFMCLWYASLIALHPSPSFVLYCCMHAFYRLLSLLCMHVHSTIYMQTSVH